MTSILSWIKQFSTAKYIFNVFSLYLRPLFFILIWEVLHSNPLPWIRRGDITYFSYIVQKWIWIQHFYLGVLRYARLNIWKALKNYLLLYSVWIAALCASVYAKVEAKPQQQSSFRCVCSSQTGTLVHQAWPALGISVDHLWTGLGDCRSCVR